MSAEKKRGATLSEEVSNCAAAGIGPPERAAFFKHRETALACATIAYNIAIHGPVLLRFEALIDAAAQRHAAGREEEGQREVAGLIRMHLREVSKEEDLQAWADRRPAAEIIAAVGQAGIHAANISADCMEMLWLDQIKESK